MPLRTVRGFIGSQRGIERHAVGFDLIEQRVPLRFPFLPEDALNFHGASRRQLDVSEGSVVASEDEHPVVAGF